MAAKKPKRRIADAPMVRIPAALLAELDREAELYARGTKMSRIQLVSVIVREWLDARRAQREGTPSKAK